MSTLSRQRHRVRIAMARKPGTPGPAAAKLEKVMAALGVTDHAKVVSALSALLDEVIAECDVAIGEGDSGAPKTASMRVQMRSGVDHDAVASFKRAGWSDSKIAQVTARVAARNGGRS